MTVEYEPVPGWLEALWNDLDTMPDLEQIVAAGAWISAISRDLLPALAARRREKTLAVLDQDGWDQTRLAESIGSRTAVVRRLVEEGRRDARDQEKRILARQMQD